MSDVIGERGDPRDTVANQLPLPARRYRTRAIGQGRYQVISPDGKVYITNVSLLSAVDCVNEMNRTGVVVTPTGRGN